MLFSDIDTAVCSGGALLQFVGLSVSIVIDYTFIQGRLEYTLGILVRGIFFSEVVRRVKVIGLWGVSGLSWQNILLYGYKNNV